MACRSWARENMTMNVTLKNHAWWKNPFEAFALKRVLTKAIEALNQVGAWPLHKDGIKIRIVAPNDHIGAGGGGLHP